MTTSHTQEGRCFPLLIASLLVACRSETHYDTALMLLCMSRKSILGPLQNCTYKQMIIKAQSSLTFFPDVLFFCSLFYEENIHVVS